MSARRLGVALCLIFSVGCARPDPEPALVAEDSHRAQPGDGPAGPDAASLARLPGVAGVEVLVPVRRPANRVIHIRDRHFVPRDLYALDLRQAAGRPLGDQEVGDRFREFLQEVDAVQQDQESILAAPAARHGLRRVLVEGLMPEGAANYRDVLAAFRATEDQIARLREAAAGLDGPPADIDRQIDAMASKLREESLEYGAAGRLAGRGAVDVLPLDDANLLAGSKPVRPDGTVGFDPAKVEARHDGQVRRALAAGPCAVLVLGGAHDLSAAVRRLGGGTTEYVRVTPRRYAGAGDK